MLILLEHDNDAEDVVLLDLRYFFTLDINIPTRLFLTRYMLRWPYAWLCELFAFVLQCIGTKICELQMIPDEVSGRVISTP